MSVTKLTTTLTIISVVFAAVLLTELLLVLRRRRSQPPISGNTSYYPAKELLHFFCFKPNTRVKPSSTPADHPAGPSPESPEDLVIDVFKLLEANGPSRFLSTINEDDSEYTESTVDSGVDSGEAPAEGKKVSLKECLEAEAAAEKAAKGAKTVALSLCDSPMFFTPVESPAREFVATVTGKRWAGEPVKGSYGR